MVRSAEDPNKRNRRVNKRNRRVNFENHTDTMLGKQDDNLGMPERNRTNRSRKLKKQPVFTMTRGAQEPISTRTRSQGILTQCLE